MKLTFLGTGGGRFATIWQSRWTGGLYVEVDGIKIHTDPGPGALVRMKEVGLDPTETDMMFISHRHPDHCADAEIMIVAMTAGKKKPTGTILGSQSALEGVEHEGPSISAYLQTKVLTRLPMYPGDKMSKESVSLTAKPAYHSDSSTIGYILESKSFKLGYLPDSDYHSSLCKEYHGCDALVVSVTRPRNGRIPYHMSTDDVKKLIEGAEPKKVFLTHFGLRMIKTGPENEAEWLKGSTGVDVVSASDGMSLVLSK